MKRTILFLLFVCAMVACAPVASTAISAVPGAPKGEIVLVLSDTPEGAAGYQQLVDAFAKVQPNIKVTINNVPDSAQFLKRLAADFAAKTPPDVFLINYRRFGQFAIKGVLEPVDGFIAESQVIEPADFYSVALDAFKFKGKQYCLPQNLSSLQVYYNKKLFTAANVPFPKSNWTWNDFLSAARALTKSANGKVVQYGLGVDPVALRLAPFIWAHGGELVDDLNKPVRLALDSVPSREAFQWFVNLQVKEHVVPSKADEATEKSQSRFQHGTLGMLLQSRSITPELRDTIKDFEWDIAPLPGDNNVATMLHSDGYCIARDSKNKSAAWAFVEFANSSEGQKIIVASGRTVPSLKSVAESPLFLSSKLAPASNRVYLDMAPHIRRVPIMTTWLDIEDALNQEIKRAFYGDASVNDAIRSAASQTQEYFRLNQGDVGQ
ncbi:MAG: sugar ABC transporter substrate-binding protein [Chloroflexi bacterium]|nr:sugar ABC transporter substrate-binding protein [Chloroflexota bacterium]